MDYKKIKLRSDKLSTSIDRSEMVCVSFPVLKNAKETTSKHYMILYIGQKVAERLGIYHGDKIKFFVAKGEPRIWLIKKSDNDDGHTVFDKKLKSGYSSRVLIVQKKLTEFIPAEQEISVHPVEFEIVGDGIKIGFKSLGNEELDFIEAKRIVNKQLKSNKLNISDKVRVSFPFRSAAKNTSSKRHMNLYLGKSIAEKVGIQKGDKIKFYVASSNPRIWLIKRSHDNVGYTISEYHTASSNALIFQKIWKEFIPTDAEIATHSVQYEVVEEGIKVILSTSNELNDKFLDFIEIKPPAKYLTGKRSRSDTSEQVRVSFRSVQSKTPTGRSPKYRMCLSLGKKLAQKVGIQCGDKVKFYISSEDPHAWLIKKSYDNSGYKVCESNKKSKKSSYNYIIQAPWTQFTPSASELYIHTVPYKIFENGIIINSKNLENTHLNFSDFVEINSATEY